MTRVDTILEKYTEAKRDALIPILQEIQEQEGFLGRDSVQKISKHLDLPASKIYGVATFYNQFRFAPLGKYHIQICRGTACHVKGSEGLQGTLERELEVKAGETTKDGLFSLEVVACIGACGLAPVVCINGEFHAEMNSQRIRKVLQDYRQSAEQKGEDK